jgi:hypothetical protein
MSRQLRKIQRKPGGRAEQIRAWAEKSYYLRYGERAVKIAVVCRESGLRDLVIPVSAVAECIPKLAERVPGAKCQHGGMWGGTGMRLCGEPAVLLTITDSGRELFFCEEHAEERVVRLP